jgi:hypothetical protein
MKEHYLRVMKKKDKAINQLHAYKTLIAEELKIIKQIVHNLNNTK